MNDSVYQTLEHSLICARDEGYISDEEYWEANEYLEKNNPVPPVTTERKKKK